MANGQAVENVRSFTVTMELFDHPNLDIYGQMVCIVLQSYPQGSVPTLNEISRLGRMTSKQATRALQQLVDRKILSHKLFREIVGQFADDRLTWAAKGILAYCIEHPHTDVAELLELSSQSGQPEHHLHEVLGELNRYGYLDDYSELKKAARQ
jgi:hypothetical protein